MTAPELIHHRLLNQRIAETKFSNPQEVVSWMAAIQAQEFAMAKWSIGLRMASDKSGIAVSKEEDVEKAFNKGAILRTHLLRPTWHFVTPADIRWLLVLTGPRVNAGNAFMYRKMELENVVFKRSNDTIIKALSGGKQLTRIVLKEALARKKIVADGIRLSLLMMKAELDAIICSGAREGNQFTYALLDERVPPAKSLTREEALRELTLRYFTSRGPATLADFVTWSGLMMKDVKQGVASIKSQLEKAVIDGKEYLFMPSTSGPGSALPGKKFQATFLMPDYDEYGMSYKDRSAIFDPGSLTKPIKCGSPVYNRMIVINGRIAGTWKRTFRNSKAFIETVPFSPLTKKDSVALGRAIERFLSFIDK
jgi:Winged helix DNA-binding domain